MFVIFYLKKFLQVTICPFLCRSPPKYVRAQLYHYHFTNENETTNYWRRDLQYEYLPLISPEGAAQLRATLTRGEVLPSNGENAKLEGKLADFLLKNKAKFAKSTTSRARSNCFDCFGVDDFGILENEVNCQLYATCIFRCK